jgi:hypothetical protein
MTVARMSAGQPCVSLIAPGTGHGMSAGGDTNSSVDAVSRSYEKGHHFKWRDS